MNARLVLLRWMEFGYRSNPVER